MFLLSRGERERERSTFLNLVWSALTQVVVFASCLLKICKHHYSTSFCQWHFPFHFNLINMFFHLPFTSYLVAHALFFPPLQNSTLFSKPPLSLLKTCPYHRAPLALASSSKISFKPSKLVSSWLFFFSINITPNIALVIAFSVFLKIANSFSLGHHVSLPYSNADLTQL